MNQGEFKIESNPIDKIIIKLRDKYREKATDFIPSINLVRQFKGSKYFFENALELKDIDDFIAELTFAMYFHHAKYIVEFISRSKGTTPDLYISNSSLRGFVEIKHIHKKHDGPEKVQSNDLGTIELLEKYAVYTRDEKYCRDKIIEGFKQLRNFSELQKTDWMIVAVWNSDEDLEEIDMESSLNQLIREESEFKNTPNPKCIIYGSDWFSLRKKTKFHVFHF